MSGYLDRLLIVLILVSLQFFSGDALGQTLPPGPQVLTFHSDADDTEQPYGLFIPKNYDASKKYPLVMMLHGAGSNHRLALRRVFGKSNADGESDVEASRYFPEWDDVDFIVASPYARGTAGYQGIPEQDVYDVLADVKRRFNIDEDRTYLTGLSMGGGGTLWLGLTRPDLWAAIAPVCPAPPEGTQQLAANAINFPVHFFHGDADPVVPVEGTRKWVAEMQEIGVEVTYKEFVDVKHDSWVSAYDAGYIFEWFRDIKRVQFPNQVRFASQLYKYNKAYWVTLEGIESGKLAEVDAKFGMPNTIKIATKNLSAFALHLNGHPMFKPGESLNLTIDGIAVSLKTKADVYLSRKGSRWIVQEVEVPISSSLKKGKNAEGPLFDVFSGRHIYVYGTAGNPSPEELQRRVDQAREAANWSIYRGDFLGRVMFFPRVISDKEVRPSDIENANLVLFGTKETNTIINQHAASLPVVLNASAKNYGLFYVFPVGKRYIAVSSGLPWWQGAKDVGYPFVPVPFRSLPRFKDVVVFKDSAENILVNEYFTGDWKASESLGKVLSGTGVITLGK